MATFPAISSAKLPFAAFDLVVYLGGAAFAVVAVASYFEVNIPVYNNPDTFNDYVYSLFIAIGILFFLYIVGHAIAYLSALFVEGLSTSTFGYPSATYRDCVESEAGEARRVIRQNFWDNVKGSFRNRAWRSNLPRFAFTLPIFLASAIIATSRNTGFASCKIPPAVGAKVDHNLETLGFPKSGEGQWFKVVEHYVNFNFDNASRRMYNYLLIYGTLRTATFVLLIAFWLEVNQFVVTRLDITWFSFPSYMTLRDKPGTLGVLLTLGFLASVCYFCYMKFNRRYFEEAMLAFALCERDSVRAK